MASKLKNWIMSMAMAIVPSFIGMACSNQCLYERPPEPKVAYTCHVPEDNLAVMVVDMQNPFLERTDICERELEVSYQVEVISLAYQNNMPVYVIETKKFGYTTEKLMEAINQSEDHLFFTKRGMDSFENRELAKSLRDRNIETILLMGIYADMCVLATAKGSLNNGFEILTSTDLIDTVAYRTNNEELDWYADNGFYCSSADDIVEQLWVE